MKLSNLDSSEARVAPAVVVASLTLGKSSTCGRNSAEYHSAMSTVQEIERAIEGLSEEEVAEIRAWLWDRDIERDAAAGQFDALAEEALQEHRSGKTRKL